MKSIQTAIFGGGCFWCVEAVFKRLRGVESVVSGYAGGDVDNPTYEQVSTGSTGHAEVTRIEYNPAKISYGTLLDVFFSSHDPTTLNKQGNDIGHQYRSIILFANEEQKIQAAEYIRRLEADKVFSDPIVTELKPAGKFYPAEDYHQNFYDKNRNYPYCSFVIGPKINKLREKYSALLKK